MRFATGSLTGNGNLVTKIHFPKEIFPLSAVLSQGFDFLISSGALIIFLAFAGVGWSVNLLWVFPLLLTLVLLIAGWGIFLSAANLFFRDVKYLVEVFLTFAIFYYSGILRFLPGRKVEIICLVKPHSADSRRA